MTNAKVKIFNCQIEDLEKKVNKFLEGKVISDIKLIPDIESGGWVTAMVIYCE